MCDSGCMSVSTALEEFYLDAFCGERSNYWPMVEAYWRCGASVSNVNREIHDSVIESVQRRRRVARAISFLTPREQAILQLCFQSQLKPKSLALAWRVAEMPRFVDIPDWIKRASENELRRIICKFEGLFGSGDAR